MSGAYPRNSSATEAAKAEPQNRYDTALSSQGCYSKTRESSQFSFDCTNTLRSRQPVVMFARIIPFFRRCLIGRFGL